MKHLIDITEWTKEELETVFSWTLTVKKHPDPGFKPLAGRSVALYFEKPSLRTRVSFDIGIQELGGNTTIVEQFMAGIGTRESVHDVANTLNGFVDAMVCRLFNHQTLHELRQWSDMSIVNALTDFSHPCQIMADVVTLKEIGLWNDGHFTLTWVGDPNNVLQSWLEMALFYPIKVIVSSPDIPTAFQSWFDDPRMKDRLTWIQNPKQAISLADVVYLDTWISMGQEDEAEARLAKYAAYQVNEEMTGYMQDHAVILHCLPAKRGQEVDDFTMNKFKPVIFRESENRLHVQKTILGYLLEPVRMAWFCSQFPQESTSPLVKA